MKFIAFYQAFRDQTIFSTQAIESVFPGYDRKILVNWQAKGHLLKVRNNWYAFTDRSFGQDDLYLIANKIYSPSYISLQSALSHYGLIPEGVFRITSVSTLKTAEFETPLGYFSYRTIKPDYFFGYRLIRQQGGHLAAWYKIATPEKAILDHLYFHPQYCDESDFEGLRLNWEVFRERVSLSALTDYLAYVDSPALTRRLNKLLNVYHAHS